MASGGGGAPCERGGMASMQEKMLRLKRMLRRAELLRRDECAQGFWRRWNEKKKIVRLLQTAGLYDIYRMGLAYCSSLCVFYNILSKSVNVT